MKSIRGPVVKKSVANGNTSMYNKLNSNTLIYILIAIVVIMLFMGTCYYNGNSSDNFTDTMISGFKNTVYRFSTKTGETSQLKDLDVIYFMSPGCPWCKKMTSVLENESVTSELTIIDVTTPDGKKLSDEMGAAEKGIPAFISKKLKTGTVGFKPSVQDLITSLNKIPEPSKITQNVQDIQDLKIIVFVSSSCGWCTKIKEELQTSGIIDMVELADVSTEEGKQMATELLKEFRGVPAFYSRATGKSSVGYKPISEIVELLK